MRRLIIVLTVLLLAAPLVAVALPDDRPAYAPVRVPESVAVAPIISEVAPPPSFSMPGEDTLFATAAATAWEFVERQSHSATGLVNPVVAYPYATIWDIASTLAAYYSAAELGILERSELDRRLGRALATVGEMRLFDDGAFNKSYDVRRGSPTTAAGEPLAAGYGWSTTDIGRLLIWLRIIATRYPEHRPAVEAIVDRLDFDRLVREGYLQGSDRDSAGRIRTYPEARVGYEQYAAAGFALWDHYADKALSIHENARPLEVNGVPMLTDTRENPHLTSEPFLLMGMEVGWWSPSWKEQAEALLAAQKARFDETGQMTIISEDAVPVPPYYFYYYTVHAFERDFAVVSLASNSTLAGPRWISAKGAFGWYALYPEAYTWEAVQAVLPARNGNSGWAAGIYEQSGRSTGGYNVNTAAVILEAALYHRLRTPILEAAGAAEG